MQDALKLEDFAAEMALLAEWYGKEISKPLMMRMYDILSILSAAEFKEACKGVLAHERFFPPLERFIELSNPQAMDKAKREWEKIELGSSDLDEISRGLPSYLSRPDRKGRDEFIREYIRASILSGQERLTIEKVNAQLVSEMNRLGISAQIPEAYAVPGKMLVSDLDFSERIEYLRQLKSVSLLEAAS
ncbi:MAG: hypothetical protein AAGD25_06360 [Cyanobacteria bacterium P01_F01_bin.150]